MFRKIALALAVLFVVLCGIVAIQPAEFAIERSVTIAAPPGVVYPHLASLRAWEAWSPWSKMDPEQQNVYTGSESGVGAVMDWDGPQAGSGRATIVGVKPDEEIDVLLEFRRPMEATNQARFALVPAPDGTTVTWRLEGRNGFVAKAFGLVMDMDRMVGGEFEKGLAKLKSLAEEQAPSTPASS